MKRSRRILSFFLTLQIAAAFIPAHADENGGWELAFAMLERETGYTREQLTPGQILEGGGTWDFSVFINEHPEDEDGMLLCEIDKNGNLLSITGPEKIGLETQLENDLKSCFRQDDCYARLADAAARWQPRLAALSSEEKQSIWPAYRKAIEIGIVQPDEAALAYPAALRAALDGAAARMGWTADMADLYCLIISAYYISGGSPVWFFYFEQHSYFEKEYESDEAMDRYQQQLERAFAKDGQEAPYSFGILIDAVTGELKEAPMLDYIPTRFNYLDFLIRTEETVASIEGK